MTRRLITMLMTTAAVVAMHGPAVAQAPAASPGPQPNIFGNMPGAVILLIPIALGGALYLSYRLGRPEEAATQGHRREGPVSRALSRREEQG